MGWVARFRQIPLVLLPLALITNPFRCSGLPPQSNSTQAGPKRQSGVVVMIVDENGVAVPSVQVSLRPRGGTESERANPSRGETDYAGRCEFEDLKPGLYELRAEKEDFFAFVQNDLRVAETGRSEEHTSELQSQS